jgi:hypothetical protein
MLLKRYTAIAITMLLICVHCMVMPDYGDRLSLLSISVNLLYLYSSLMIEVARKISGSSRLYVNVKKNSLWKILRYIA